MLADTQLFVMWVVFTAIPFWLLPNDLGIWRLRWLITTSIALIFALAPYALLYVAWIALICAVFCHRPGSQPSQKSSKNKGRARLTVGLVLVCIPLLTQRLVFLDPPLLHTLGITFATLRGVAMIFDNHVAGTLWSLRQIALTLFFVPLYTVGPIEKVATFNDAAFAKSPDWLAMLRAVSRCCLGLFKTVFLAEQLIRGYLGTHYSIVDGDFSQYSVGSLWLFVCLSFLYTYINFSGFVDIAIGVSRLFGLTVMENFNLPVLATNLQDFWQRWHRSLGQWITRYLYFPVVAAIRRPWAPYLATLTAFGLIGWWHASSTTYIAWGVMHGIGLCTVMGWQRYMKASHKARYGALVTNPIYIGVSWLLTLAFVAWVQTFANQTNLAASVSLTRHLLGL